MFHCFQWFFWSPQLQLINPIIRALPPPQKHKGCCKGTRDKIARHNFDRTHWPTWVVYTAVKEFTTKLTVPYTEDCKIRLQSMHGLYHYSFIQVFLAYSFSSAHSLACFSADLLAWAWFTERLPKTKHGNISNCEPNFCTCIPILFNDHWRNWFGARFAIHFK